MTKNDIIDPFTNIEQLPATIADQGAVFLSNLRELNIGDGGDNVFRADRDGIFLGADNFADAPFKVTMAGAVTAMSIIITGGTIKFGKVSFTDSAHDGYYIGSGGLYFGSVGDATKIKYTIATGLLDIIGAITGSTITGGTITGSTIRTALPDNVRVTMKSILYAGGTDASLVFYNSSNDIIGGISEANEDGIQRMTLDVGISDGIEIGLGFNANENKMLWRSHGVGGTYGTIASLSGLGDFEITGDIIVASGDIIVGGTVDGVDIANHTHTGGGGGTVLHSSLGSVGVNDHHSSTSNGLSITPTDVTTNSIYLNDLAFSPATAGQILYFDSGGTQNFRGKAGSFVGSFDLTAV